MNEKSTKNNLNGGFAFLVMIALFLLISFLGQSILTSAKVAEGRLYYAISATFSSLAIVVVLLYAKNLSKSPLLSLIQAKKTKHIYFGLAVVLSIGMFLGLGFLNSALASLFARWGLNISTTDITFEKWYDVVIFGVLLAVFPAMLEESFFRGIMLNGAGGNGIKTLLSISLCFALYHGNIATLFYQFIYGLALTYLAVKSGSILPSVLAHFINNFTVIAFTFFGVNVNLFNPIVIVIGLSLLAVFWVSICLVDKERGVCKGDSVKQFWIPSGILGAGLMTLLILLNAFA